MYSLLRPLLFRLDAERSHHLTLEALKLADRLALSRWLLPSVSPQPVKVMGLAFPNPVGLAAGLDKNGDYLDALGALGFGFVEVGTVTPKPQPGNPRPRLFRLREHDALINRMGFNNKGVDHLVRNVRRRRYRGILGINIGKNASTPMAEAAVDYLHCLDRVYPWADYIAVNISSPNTPGLRRLQHGEQLRELLRPLKSAQGRLADQYRRYVPIAVKIAPDMQGEEVQQVAAALEDCGMDGVIATNTTMARDPVVGHPAAEESGGLSGAVLAPLARHSLTQLREALGDRLPIIAAGGIHSGAEATARMDQGAQLVQLYSGLIYRGPGLVAEVAAALAERTKESPPVAG